MARHETLADRLPEGVTLRDGLWYRCACGREQHADMIEIHADGELRCDGCCETLRRQGEYPPAGGN